MIGVRLAFRFLPNSARVCILSEWSPILMFTYKCASTGTAADTAKDYTNVSKDVTAANTAAAVATAKDYAGILFEFSD